MFKKFLNNILGGDDQDKKPAQPGNQHASAQPDHDEDDDYEEEEDDDDRGGFYMQPPSTIELDPETLHGKHYTVAQFDAEVERRVQAWVASEREDGEDVTEGDINNFRFNYRREVYKEWTGVNDNQLIQWENKNSMQHRGHSVFGFEQHDDNNPLLAPIHGVSLQDYGAISSKIASGASVEDVCKALNIEKPVWDEASTLWNKRMQEDGSFTVINLFSKYFGEADQHPVLGKLGAAYSPEVQVHVDKIHNDRYYYEELCGARQAAYEYGIDGAQWILENYGIPLGEFQNAATKWMTEQNQNFDMQKINHFMDYQQEKQKEYAKRFAAEQGGNVADDVEF